MAAWRWRALCVVLLLVAGSVAWAEGAANKGEAPLLAQVIRVERPNLKAQGKFTLRSVSPLAGELVLDTLDGDPKELKGVLGLLGSWAGQLAETLDTDHLTVTGLQVVVAAGVSTLRLQRLSTPEGWLEEGRGERMAPDQWHFKARQARFERLPVRLRGVGPLTDLVVDQLHLQRNGNVHSVEAPRLGALGAVVERFSARTEQGEGPSAPLTWQWQGRQALADAGRMQEVLYRWPGVSTRFKAFLAEEQVQKLTLAGKVTLLAPKFQGVLPKGAEVGPWQGKATVQGENWRVDYVAPDANQRPRPATFQAPVVKGLLHANEGKVRLEQLEPKVAGWPPVLQRLLAQLGVET